MSAKRRLGYFTLSAEVLRRLLALPEGYRIVALREADRFEPIGIDIALEGPGLPEVDESELTPRIYPVLYEAENGRITIVPAGKP